MINTDYMRPGLAAITLAILFPAYWLHAVTVGDFSPSVFDNDIILRLTAADWLFLLIGVLLVYIYFSFKRILVDHHNFHGIDLLVTLFVCISIIFYGGFFLIDVLAVVLGEGAQSILVAIGSILLIGGGIIYGVIDILIGVMLLRDSDQRPGLLKIFALATLIMGLFEVMFLSVMSIFIYPVAMIILAVYFLRKPEILEVV